MADADSPGEGLVTLLVVRLATAVTVLAVAAAAPEAVGVGLGPVAPVTVAYMALAGVSGRAWRRAGAAVAAGANMMLLADVVYLGAIIAVTGGPGSRLAFLVYVHLIAVTLLGTHRGGLVIALLDSVMFILLFTFTIASPLARALGAARARPVTPSAVVLAILALWLIATGTAFFSWVNERELRRSKAELEALAEMGAALERSTSPEQIMQVLLAKSTSAFRFARGAVLLGGPAGTIALSTGHPEPVAMPDCGPDALVLRAWSQRGPVLVASLDPAVDPVLASLLPEARNVVVLPLAAEGDPLGALAVERGGPFAAKLSVPAVTMLAQFGANAALAVRNTRLMAEVERLANQDGLTGLANRRAFEEVLAREVARSRRSGEPLSLVALDVDHFKRVNDTRGHPAGDDVLRHVARVLAQAARDIDLVARYGGEEFTVVLPNCSFDDALAVAERMRDGVAADPDAAGVTLSAGVATLPANATDGEGLIAAADEAMYQSKRAGRDRTTGSTRRHPPTPVVGR